MEKVLKIRLLLFIRDYRFFLSLSRMIKAGFFLIDSIATLFIDSPKNGIRQLKLVFCPSLIRRSHSLGLVDDGLIMVKCLIRGRDLMIIEWNKLRDGFNLKLIGNNDGFRGKHAIDGIGNDYRIRERRRMPVFNQASLG